MIASLLPKDQNLKVEGAGAASAAFQEALFALPSIAKLEKEIARLKEENASLTGKTPEDEPETTTDTPAVH